MSIHFLRSGRKSTTVRKVCTKIGARVLYAKEGWTLINGVPTKVFDSGYVTPDIPDPEPVLPTIVKYLAISYDGSVYYADDGINFTRSTHLLDPGEHACMYNAEDQYYYICNLRQTRANWCRTHDGITFEAVTGPETNLGAACMANGYMVVLENNSTNLHYAAVTNPQSWSTKNILDLNQTVYEWESLKYCPNHGRWVGIVKSFSSGTQNSTWYILFSSPANEISALSFEFSRIGTLVEAGDKYYIMASVYVGTRPNGHIERYLMESSDGLDFDVSLDLGQNITASQTFDNQFTANNGAVTVTTATTSNAGINVKVAGVWNLYQLPMSIASMNYPMTYINGTFIIIKNDTASAVAAWSVDGTNWTGSTPTSNSGTKCIINAGHFAYFASEDGVIQNTADGATWNNTSLSGALYLPTKFTIASSEA